MSRFFVPFKTTVLFSLITALSAAVPASAMLSQQQNDKKAKPVHVENKNAPTIIRAEQITGRKSRDMYMDYDVEIERDQTIITGDHGVLHNEENDTDMVGNVFIQRFGDQFSADQGNFNLDTQEGTLKHAYYKLEVGNRQGRAARIDLTGKDTADLFDSTMTTCEGLDPDWYLKSNKMHIDQSKDIGYATSPVLYFKDVPILGAPALTFPVNGERKSGFLPPTIDINSTKGLEITAPYYVNLAPNYDLTLYPNLMTKRGLQLGAEYRYLGENYAGNTYIEYLPHDKENGHRRYLYATQHQQRFADGWGIKWDYRGASDNDYPDDFSMYRNAGALNTISSFRDWDDDDQKHKLRRYGQVSKSFSTENFGSWRASLTASGYQILQDWDSIIRRDHSRLPQLTLSGHDDGVNGFDWNFRAEATRFWLDNRDLDYYWGTKNWKQLRDRRRLGKYDYNQYKQNRGNRYVIEPSVSYPIYHAGWFFVPKAKVNYTNYKLEDLDNTRVPNTSLTRTLPTLTLDSGLIFERESAMFGEGGIQTLEPRLFYAYTPYKNQEEFPIFDSSLMTFGYAKLFSANPYSGGDRIVDQNSLTAALTTKFLEEDGTERLHFTAGQKFNFQQQRVYMYRTSEDNSRDYSDLLLQASGQLTNEFEFDSNLQYGWNSNKVNSSNVAMHWKPGPMKALNAEYRYMHDEIDGITGEEIDQTIISGQWPISDRWYIVGQHNFSFADDRTIESILGLEYNADCWVLRLVAQHEATSADDSSNSFYVQLELKGFAAIGNNPVKEIQDKVTGYDALTERYQTDDSF